MKKIIILFFLFIVYTISAQNTSYWQQHVDYTMDIDMDVKTYQYKGKQKIVYTNNSPDSLDKVFYHLFFNAFQPGSEMDIRLKNMPDPDKRMVNNIGTNEEPIYESRISKLKTNEYGYQKIITLKQNGKPVKFKVIGTILKVDLNTVIQSGEKAIFEMEFEAQVPNQIRRSGRNNKEGIALSMTQWYPKLVEYDFEGWHANAYISREFHGVWGDYDVTIHIDKNYTIGGSGYLQNPQEIGHGYEDPSKKLKVKKGKKLSWHFKAPNVHDFAWAADDKYIHDKIIAENNVTLHFLYKDNPETNKNWKELQPKTAEILAYYNKHIGQYPYKQYSVIQGGDGGMEYAMCTLITGGKNFNGLVSVTAHEFAHTWFQFLLASNETKHSWMDEGFTSYISHLAMNEVMDQKKVNPSAGGYKRYYYFVQSGFEDPLSMHADRFNSNFAYGISAYNKGEVFLAQLGYVIGKENLRKTIKKYFQDFEFKHPVPNDIKRTAEIISGIELDWYLNYWTQTTNTIDYSVKSIDGREIQLENIGTMPMPIDLTVTYVDGTKENFNIPLRMMYDHKPTNATVLDAWPWVQPIYSFSAAKMVKSVIIDPLQNMADINKKNNLLKAK